MTVDSTLVCGKSKPVNTFMLDPSAYADSFARDHLPPIDLWPTIDGEALAALGYPPRMNAAVELLDGAVARARRAAMPARTQRDMEL